MSLYSTHGVMGMCFIYTCKLFTSYELIVLMVIVARGEWFSEVCSGREAQEMAVSKWVKCKMRNTCV